MTPSQLYIEESQNGKLKAEIKEILSTKALSRYEAEELIQLNVLNEIERPRKINPSEIKRLKENHNMTSKEKLDTISHLYSLNGFEIVDRDRLSVELFRKKRFSYLSAFLWFLLLGVGLVIYILYYLVKGDDKVAITIEDNYKVKPDVEMVVQEDVFFGTISNDMDDGLEEINEESQELFVNSDDEIIEDSFDENLQETPEVTGKTEEERLLEELNAEDELQEEVSEVREKTEEEKLLEELDDSSEKIEQKPKTEEEKLLEELSK